MHYRAGIAGAVLSVALTISGCASSGAGPKPAKLPTARMISQATFDPTSRGVRNLTSADVKYEVEIAPDGTPDLFTFKISGTGASELRNAIREWIGASRFEPSRLNGVPVKSLHKGGLKMRRQ